ncbi:MAG: DUF2851 family protein [Candidatus Cloacimonetes bacterium]|nr:DUF2851 family protein [Candidatus Cloacimonadota bacterium]
MEFTEEFLYHIWDAQHLNNKLETKSGKKLNIKFSGRWNTDSGPDFKDSIIVIEDEVKRGDVEIDLTSYQWKSHSHNENPEFNQVLLHVIYENQGNNPYTISEDGTKIEILEIKDQLDVDISKLLKQYSNKSYSEKDKFCKLFDNLNSKETADTLLKMGMIRFEKKIKRFKAEHYFNDYDQLLYSGIMEALGYSKNKFHMLQFAMDLPYKDLQEFYAKGMSKDEMTAILICSSNLIETLPKMISDELKNTWQNMYLNQKYMKKTITKRWNMFRIRPVNHPAVRLLQITDLLYKSLKTSLFHNSLKLFSFPSDVFKLSDFKRKLYKFFQTESHLLQKNYKLGKTRIDTILINILLPITIIYAREKRYEKLENAILEVYRDFPALPANNLTNYMGKFMDDKQKKLINKKAVFQQGLLNIYFSNCQHHYCDACVSSTKYNLYEMIESKKGRMIILPLIC